MNIVRLSSRKTAIIGFMSFFTLAVSGQEKAAFEISHSNPPSEALAPLRFLAADELMGRGTMRSEIHIAARYVSEEFRATGLRTCQGANDYFQSFDIKSQVPSKTGTLKMAGKSYTIGNEVVEINGDNLTFSAPVVYAGFGTGEDLDKAGVQGKIVVAKMGFSDTSKINEAFHDVDLKRKMVKDRGGVALIELYRPMGFPWSGIVRFLSSERPEIENSDKLPELLLNDSLVASKLQGQGTIGSIDITDVVNTYTPAENVLGWVEGSDPKLKDEFIVLSAHYDHLGVAKKPKMEEGKMDSIYNGARDNALGTTAVIDAARYFAKHPPKRSILFIAYTGEEIGEIGSKYFSEHPLVPLRQIVYNLNIDNASYDDTTIVTVVGLGRTTADADIKKACAAFQVTAMPDLEPEQDLFDRSDNVNLAEKGIPAPTFSLGMRKFDAEINKRYHQLSDEVGNLNLSYCMKFINSFILSAENIANDQTRPVWIPGDKYEAAAKTLYGN
ncbi:MAG TPA: M28 family peptidase [Puia sp.]|nr:M28 family peptidase [Puia sp.]